MLQLVTGHALVYLFVDFLVLGFGLGLGLFLGNWFGAALVGVLRRPPAS